MCVLEAAAQQAQASALDEQMLTLQAEAALAQSKALAEQAEDLEAQAAKDQVRRPVRLLLLVLSSLGYCF